jgi:hypothetical protein
VTALTDAIPRKKFVGLANQRIIYQEYSKRRKGCFSKKIKINENKKLIMDQ